MRASILEFVSSFRTSIKGMLLVSGLRESLKAGKRWTPKKEKSYQELRSFIEELVLKHAKDEQDLSVLFF